MANQIIIDIGAVANDGTGDPLRTAFGYVNDNFSNVWATGVANANIAFSGNKILTTNTNGNLVLAPNGTGKVVANVDIVPNTANVRNLGALTNRWSTVYSQYLNVSGEVDFTGDVTVGGNLTVTGNISGNTAGYTIGYRDIPQLTLSANATAALTDAGKHFYSTTAGNLQVTIPDNANVAYPVGATLTIVTNAAGNVVVAQGTGVSLYMAGSSSTGNRVVGAYGLASVMKVATDTWVISGTGVY